MPSPPDPLLARLLDYFSLVRMFCPACGVFHPDATQPWIPDVETWQTIMMAERAWLRAHRSEVLAVLPGLERSSPYAAEKVRELLMAGDDCNANG